MGPKSTGCTVISTRSHAKTIKHPSKFKSTVRKVYFMKSTSAQYLLGMWCVVCMFRKSTVRPVFFMKSPVFVGYVVSSVYVQEKYRTSGIFYENHLYLLGMCVCSGKVPYVRYFYEKYRMSSICWVCICSV